MAQINLLPWRHVLNEQRKKKFMVCSIVSAILGCVFVLLLWCYFYDQQQTQQQINQQIVQRQQHIKQQLLALDGVQQKHSVMLQRMQLIQDLQGQRPITVRLLDELVRMIPNTMYLTKFMRQGNQFRIEGKTDSPNTVAELLRFLDTSPWYQNAVMNSFVAIAKTAKQTEDSQIESDYGEFVVTANLGEIAIMPIAQSSRKITTSK